jgi:hypothetical protein
MAHDSSLPNQQTPGWCARRKQAADCYRKVIDFIRHHPDRYDTGMVEQFAKLIDRLIRPPPPERRPIARTE